jgi:hypothetical protein
MIVGFIKKSKYDEHFEKFMTIKNKDFYYTLKQYCKENEINYANMKRCCARRGHELHKHEKVYTVIQISVNESQYNKIKSMAGQRDMSLPYTIRSLIDAI